MKKIILSFILYCYSLTILAQAPVMNSTWLPQAGDIYSFYNAPNAWDYFDESDTGENVTWDFSNIQIADTPYGKINYKNISEIPNSCNAPANLLAGDSMSHTCYIRTATMLKQHSSQILYGDTTTTPNSYKFYTIPQISFRTDINFRDTKQDTSKYYYYRSNTSIPTDSPTRGHTTISRHYDGYGTLRLPHDTFDTVARLHIIRIINDSLYGKESTALIYEHFSWYVPGHGTNVFYVGYIYFMIYDSTIGGYDTQRVEKHAHISISNDSGGTGYEQMIAPEEEYKAFFTEDKLYLISPASGALE